MTTLSLQADTGPASCIIHPRLKPALSQGVSDKYGRMFPDLAPLRIDEALLLALGRSGAVMDDTELDVEIDAGDNPYIPAGWTFFGQFIAHDITADRSLIQHHANVDELHNFRKPRLDLECVYAAGPAGTPFMYDIIDPDKFLLGMTGGFPLDVPRNSQGRALVGDPRNDVHTLISQHHVAFLHFHNQVVEWLREGGTSRGQIFAEAQRVVRWHYQWIVVSEFLPLTCGEGIVEDILTHGPRFYRFELAPFLPVEFADAAYRYGHSQIRATYQLNEHVQGGVFPDCAGSCPLASSHVLDWRYFYALDPDRPPQKTRRLDARLVHSLIDLPESIVGDTDIPEHHSLAVRDLLRGSALDLPSGEAVSRAMGIEPMSGSDLGLDAIGWQGETPLWYYVLRESEIRENGERLGPVAGRIVAEVLLGLVAADPRSYRSLAPDWRPTLPAATAGDFTMADLLRFARVPGTS